MSRSTLLGAMTLLACIVALILTMGRDGDIKSSGSDEASPDENGGAGSGRLLVGMEAPRQENAELIEADQKLGRTYRFETVLTSTGQSISLDITIGGRVPHRWSVIESKPGILVVRFADAPTKAEYLEWGGRGYLGGRSKLLQLIAGKEEHRVIELPVEESSRAECRLRVRSVDGGIPLENAVVTTRIAHGDRAEVTVEYSADRNGVILIPVAKPAGRIATIRALGYLSSDVIIPDLPVDMGEVRLHTSNWTSNIRVTVPSSSRRRPFVWIVRAGPALESPETRDLIGNTPVDVAKHAVRRGRLGVGATGPAPLALRDAVPGQYVVYTRDAEAGDLIALKEVLLSPGASLDVELLPRESPRVEFEGEGLQGARVKMTAAHGSMPRCVSRGREARGVFPGTYRAVVSRSDGSRVTLDELVVVGDSGVVVAKVPDAVSGTRVRGQVVSRTLRPVVGVIVALVGTTARAPTTAGGIFEFDAVSPGTYLIRVSADGPRLLPSNPRKITVSKSIEMDVGQVKVDSVDIR